MFEHTEEEVPHSITCVTDSVGIGKSSYNIKVSVIVDRDSIKRIVIGKQGEMIKRIGIAARRDLEALLNKTVYLELFVKTADIYWGFYWKFHEKTAVFQL